MYVEIESMVQSAIDSIGDRTFGIFSRPPSLFFACHSSLATLHCFLGWSVAYCARQAYIIGCPRSQNGNSGSINGANAVVLE